MKNDRLPPLYRAADAFVTCSTSETYGLTVLEALACGTPAVLPHCSVFDELWEARLPAEWMYNHGEAAGLLSSLAAAVTPGSKQRLRKEPVKASLGQSRPISANLGGSREILGKGDLWLPRRAGVTRRRS